MSVPTISAADLNQKIEAGEDVKILDVREPMERAEVHIANSEFIPLGQLPGRYAELNLQKDEPVYIYCRSGKRSASACSFLQQEGYKAVNVSGGILDWQAVPGVKLGKG